MTSTHLAELFGLVYESMTMEEQEAKFEGLSEFVAQLVEDKELKGKKFEEGLRSSRVE